MTIIHTIDSLAVGGAEMLLVNFIRYFKAQAPQTKHVLVLTTEAQDLLPVIASDIEALYIIPFSKKHLVQGVYEWGRVIRRHKPALIHTHLYYPMMMARLGTTGNTPIVSTYHNQCYCAVSPYFSPYFGVTDRWTFRKKKHHRIFVSEAVRDCVEKATGIFGNGEVIPNFVSEDFYPAWQLQTARSPLRLVAVGNVKKVKNHELILEALALLPPGMAEVSIYGDGELKEILTQEATRRNLPVYFLGSASLSADLLKDYDVFLMPSVSEGQPVSLLESMTTGLPSLLSDIPPLRQLAGESAYYFQPDAPRQLAALIRQMAENRALLTPLSEHALRKAAAYSIARYYDEVCVLYQKAIGTKQPI